MTTASPTPEPSDAASTEESLPKSCLPTWDVTELPKPKPLGLRNLAGFIGPGIVMCGIQIGGGEWLFGPSITAKYGGGLMWIATVAIICQVFYNIECGRYALYTGEPVFTGFMRTKPGPKFWVFTTMVLSIGSLIPGLSTNASVLIASIYLDRPATTTTFGAGDTMVVYITSEDGRTASPQHLVGSDQLRFAETDAGVLLSGSVTPGATVALKRLLDGREITLYGVNSAEAVTTADAEGAWSIPFHDDSFMVNTLAYVLLGLIVIPVLLGGKVYNMLQVVMTAKVFTVLGFCLLIGLFFVSAGGWADIFSGFLKIGNVPVENEDGSESVVNAFSWYYEHGVWPAVALGNIALLGAFAGYAGGGGLSNSTYSNFVRDKGWGMGSQVGAIPSAIGGKSISLSHIGKVFALTEENMKRWKAWWKYIIFDQAFVWGPGCFMGMALPALMSIEFSRSSPMFGKDIPYAQSLMAADGIRNSTELGTWAPLLWVVTLFVGLMVFVPSQISIVDDFARRWTDIIWSSNSRVRNRMEKHRVNRIYYGILFAYVLWSFISATIFLQFGDAPKLMVTVIANLNNVALGVTAFHVLWINRRFLPRVLQPRWYSQLGIATCGVFYLGLALLVFVAKIVPMMTGN